MESEHRHGSDCAGQVQDHSHDDKILTIVDPKTPQPLRFLEPPFPVIFAPLHKVLGTHLGLNQLLHETKQRLHFSAVETRVAVRVEPEVVALGPLPR